MTKRCWSSGLSASAKELNVVNGDPAMGGKTPLEAMFSTFTPARRPGPEGKSEGAKRRFDAQFTSRPSTLRKKGEPGTVASAPFDPILNMAKSPSSATARNLPTGVTFILTARPQEKENLG